MMLIFNENDYLKIGYANVTETVWFFQYYFKSNSIILPADKRQDRI